MKNILVIPVLAAALFGAACSDDPTSIEPVANVRFVNATTGSADKGGFTVNGTFASQSALGGAHAAQACSSVAAGSTSFGFGAANSSGTALSGGATGSLGGKSIASGGNYIVAATGSATSPTLYLLDNTFSGSIGSNQAAVRFVNLAPGASLNANTFTVLAGVLGAGSSLTAADIEVGNPTAFKTVASGSSPYTILQGHTVIIDGAGGTLMLQAGSVNTVAIVEDASGSFRLVNLPACS